MEGRCDPRRHQRRSIRRKGWDYRWPGVYFITICTYQRAHIFEDEALRDVAAQTWQAIPRQAHAQHVVLDEWVVMPNHVHGIIVVDTDITVGAIVGNFKSLSARRINRLRRTAGGSVWQRGYYDRIVRNERELDAIRRYIVDNPRRWVEDDGRWTMDDG